MLHFDSDYMRGCHPEIMKRLVATNMEQTPGYGADSYTMRAKELILDRCGLDISTGDVVLLTGGTQTNATIIDLVACRHGGVMATDSSHINVHEAGAVEASGHKVIVFPSHDGKLSADDVDSYMESFYSDDTWRHMVRPSVVYITFPSETGTLYSLSELEDLGEVCRKWKLSLYVDGARLAYGMAASPNVTLGKIAAIADVFYIGGTKCGALVGEAVVTRHHSLFDNILTHIKAHGALMAKGRFLGIQFETLFEDNLYMRIGRNGVDTAMALKNGLLERGFRQLIDSPTNQQFFIMPNDIINKLKEEASFELWGAPGKDESAVRFVTDWGTTQEDISSLMKIIDAM